MGKILVCSGLHAENSPHGSNIKPNLLWWAVFFQVMDIKKILKFFIFFFWVLKFFIILIIVQYAHSWLFKCLLQLCIANVADTLLDSSNYFHMCSYRKVIDFSFLYFLSKLWLLQKYVSYYGQCTAFTVWTIWSSWWFKKMACPISNRDLSNNWIL